MTVVMVQSIPFMVPMPKMNMERKKRMEQTMGEVGISPTATGKTTKASWGPLVATEDIGAPTLLERNPVEKRKMFTCGLE